MDQERGKHVIPSSRPGRSCGSGDNSSLLSGLLVSSGLLGSDSLGFGGHGDDEGDVDVDDVVDVDERQRELCRRRSTKT